MGKFKVGDKVRILDGSKIKNYAGGWYKFTERYVDTITTISSVYRTRSGKIGYRCRDAWGYIFDERGLERCGNETIVIYRKDNEVISLDKRAGKKAIAKCSPEDTFDFNIGAKLAFERLMNGNKESITVEDMRKKLDIYCRGKKDCCGCKLFSSIYRCGLSVTFTTKNPNGNYEMSDEEIKNAFNIVFGTGVREVKRRSGKECKPKEPHKFKVGDIVKGNLESDDRYNITNSNMTRGKVTKVSEDGNYIDVEILEHKHGDTGNLCTLESKYFDLVEESPKLYNGKIIFTKGDGMFKTGHIYEVNNGKIVTLEYGSLPISKPLKDIEDVKDYFTGNLDGNRKREKGWSPYTLELVEVIED
nr:MAG TPA: hypothetical protein [Bacteriophage sp.]